MSDYILEPAAQEFAEAGARPPFLYELGPDRAHAQSRTRDHRGDRAGIHILRKAFGRY